MGLTPLPLKAADPILLQLIPYEAVWSQRVGCSDPLRARQQLEQCVVDSLQSQSSDEISANKGIDDEVVVLAIQW